MARKVQKPEVQIAQYWQHEFRQRRRFYLAIGGPLLGLTLALGIFNLAYAEKVFPGVIVGSIQAGGLTKEQLAAKLDEQIQLIDGKELKVTIEDKEFTVNPTKDWELSYDIEKTTQSALAVGRRTSFLYSFGEQLSSVFSNKTIGALYLVDQSKYSAWIAEVTQKVEVPEQDARLALKGNDLTVEEEKNGKRIPNNDLKKRVSNALSSFLLDPITVTLLDIQPAVSKEQATSLTADVAKMVTSDLKLTFQDKSFAARPLDLINFIELAADPSSANGVIALVSEPKVIHYIEVLAKDIDQTPVDARLTISGGKASIFTPSRDGFRIKREQAAKDIADALEKRRADTSVTTIELAVEVTLPTVRTETINDLGIQELVGRATTSFAGSPENRIHNISVGANSFHGLLIKPGETFSTVAALGNIDASTGYRAELVIKEDRLIPETGGGLCQVSSTLFRTALDSGLDIVERKNHSFRVRYYEPPVGMDATIYDPAPDLKFRNDTAGYILIQTKIEGTKLTFEFYGTKDGREVTMTTPEIYNITQPGQALFIEDPNLAPGEQKQVEKAVPGADAKFTYTVKKDGKVLHNKIFTSHYVAWRAKYLVGPAAAPPPPAEPTPPPAPPAP